jgi:hypothetical protein
LLISAQPSESAKQMPSVGPAIMTSPIKDALVSLIKAILVMKAGMLVKMM